MFCFYRQGLLNYLFSLKSMPVKRYESQNHFENELQNIHIVLTFLYSDYCTNNQGNQRNY